jgi:uncharacterized membrane protein YbhN (UPF0104 family)
MLMLTFLLLISILALIGFYLVDLFADNHIDMANPIPLIVLVMIYFILFIIVRPHKLFINKN